MRKLYWVFLLLILPLPVVLAQKSKPVLMVQKDSFPGGQVTPEGAACDLARAFIKHDAPLFKSICVPPLGEGEDSEKYKGFLKYVTEQIKKEAARVKPTPKQPKGGVPSPNGPKTILKVFAARPLSKNGPSSYGYAVLNLKAVEFVDVVVLLHNGKQVTNRTLVLQGPSGKWYVHPLPASAPLLSDGLNQESASTKDFKEAYTVQK